MPISYTLKRRKNLRSMRLSVCADGEVIVSAPKRMSVSTIESFIYEKASWIRSAVERFARFPKPIVPRTNINDFKKYKEVARELVTRRLAYWVAHPAYAPYKFTVGRISIRNQKSRWGSCSKGGNLSFSYRVALLPPDLTDYVIVHELCHIGQFNHSRAFWGLVEQGMPDWKERRKKLC